MFTKNQSKKIGIFSLALITACCLAAVGYSFAFGNPGAAFWGTLFYFSPIPLITLWSGAVSGIVKSWSGSSFTGIVVGVLFGGLLQTAAVLLFLRLIVELNDNMRIDGVSSLPLYAWYTFRDFGLPSSIVLYFGMWVLWRCIQWLKKRCSPLSRGQALHS